MMFLQERRDPPDPDPGKAIVWMSDGEQTGVRGDIWVKVNVNGTVKTGKLFDWTTA